MKPTCHRESCDGCTGRLVCRCLQVTEEALIAALATNDVRSVNDLRACTGAGDGCTACHQVLRRYLERYALGMAPQPVAVAG
jgi:NAD(P)H-nitrite reductase large subunit